MARRRRPIQLDARDFETLLRVAGRHTLLDLTSAAGKATPVLLQGVHEHPVKRVPQHVDFFVVKMTEEISVDVPVAHRRGLARGRPASAARSSIMRDSITVRALPGDLPVTRSSWTSRASTRSMPCSMSATWSCPSG